MKSLLISSEYFPPKPGGISHLMSGIASALGRERVCCLTGLAADNDSVHADFDPRVYRRPTVFTARTRYLRSAAWGAAIAEIVIRERPVATQLATAGEGPLGIWLRQWLGFPFVVYAHGNEVLLAMQDNGLKLRLALQKADRVLAVSKFTANLVKAAGVSADRIEVMHPGCDTDHFRPRSVRMDLRPKLLGERHEGKVILSVGNLVARKGQDMVIRALPRLLQTSPDVTYVLVGQGPYRAQLENLATGLGVRDRVVFTGRVSTEDLPELYSLADVFVMPSREQSEVCDVEGFGLVFLEASSCGKPVVGGHSGGIPDALVDGVTGFLVNPNDPEHIANIIARLLVDTDLSKRMGQQGRSWVTKCFTWSNVARRVQDILQSLLSEQSVDASYRPFHRAVKSLVRRAVN